MRKDLPAGSQWDGSVDRAPHWRSTAVVTDDQGERYSIRRCSGCRRWLPADYEHFTPKDRYENGMVKSWHTLCRPCNRDRFRGYYEERPEWRSKARARSLRARMNQTPEQRERSLEHKRKYKRKIDIEAKRQAQRAYYEKVRADPVRWAKQLEAQRMNYRLRRERAGLPVMERGPKQPTSGVGPELPGEPLFKAVDAFRKRHATLDDVEFAALFGISDRTIRDWRERRRSVVRLETIDNALIVMHLNWWDVYEKPANGHADDEEAWRAYRLACLHFNGELVE